MEEEEKFREAVEQFGSMAAKVVGDFVFNDTPAMVRDSLANIDERLNFIALSLNRLCDIMEGK